MCQKDRIQHTIKDFLLFGIECYKPSWCFEHNHIASEHKWWPNRKPSKSSEWCASLSLNVCVCVCGGICFIWFTHVYPRCRKSFLTWPGATRPHSSYIGHVWTCVPCFGDEQIVELMFCHPICVATITSSPTCTNCKSFFLTLISTCHSSMIKSQA